METIGDDLLYCIAQTGAHVALKMACTCKQWREVVEGGEGATFDVRRALTRIGETSLQGDLVSALALSKVHVKMGAHTKKRNRYGGFYHIFSHAAAVELFQMHGKFDRLEQRLARRTKRKGH
jgi:hypothetical protein